MAAVYTTVPTWKEAMSAPALRDLLWASMVETVKVGQQLALEIINYNHALNSFSIAVVETTTFPTLASINLVVLTPTTYVLVSS